MILDDSDYADVMFHINYGRNAKFTAAENQIKGNIILNFSRDTDIYNFELRLKGKCRMNFKHSQTTINGSIFDNYQNEHEFFDIVKQVNNFKKNKYRPHHFKKNDRIEIPIDISFPFAEMYLPSSTDCLTLDLDNQRFLKVSYKLYLKITRKTSRFGKSKVDYIDCPDSVRYQAYSSHSKKITQNEVLQPSETKIFQIKNANSFALNNANNVIGVHTKDSDLPKSIDLTVSMRIPRYFDFRVSVFCQLWFELETSYNCNIIPDLKLMDDNKDSGLGGFQIKSIEFIEHSKSISIYNGKTYEDEQNIKLAKLTDLDVNFSFNDFKYCPERQKFVLTLGSGSLYNKDTKSLMEYMGTPTFMPTCEIYNFFESVYHLSIILTIGNDSYCDQEFKYFSLDSPDYLKAGNLPFKGLKIIPSSKQQIEPLNPGIFPSYNELRVEDKTGQQLRAFKDEKIPDEAPPPYKG